MRNEEIMYVRLKRIDVCDLLLACLAADTAAGGEAKKWFRLHDELRDQLKAFDDLLDAEKPLPFN